jgi:predicted hydrocarbon binding protein
MAASKRKTTKLPTRKEAKAKAVVREAKTARKAGIIKGAQPKTTEREYVPKDLEDLLIGEMTRGEDAHPEPKLLLPTLIYNSTDSMKRLAYGYGFSVGKELFLTAGREGITPLLRVIENAGIGRTLYMPVIDTVVIKSATRIKHSINAQNNIHSYEAGMISGYLSGYTSSAIFTIETHCMYNGAPFCQFVSNSENIRGPSNSKFTLHKTIETITEAINASEKQLGGKEQNYMLLCLLPILKKPLLEESSRLMFIAGKRYAELTSGGGELERNLERLAFFFDIREMKIAKSKSETSVVLKYNAYNSMEGYLELSTKAFIGFLSKRFNSVVRLREGRLGSGYSITLSVTNGA